MSETANMEMKTTERGFSYMEFLDFNGVKCNIQKSSILDEECIWFGAVNIGLKRFKAYEGWTDVPLPFSIEEHYVANNRMHLTQEQVKNLLPILTYFAETGELPDPQVEEEMSKP
jgi:hypothetical protein